MERKQLPIGVASFQVIRENGLYYVDKTRFLHKLVSTPWVSTFLSRPRRFGKSLFLDTIKCLYEGKKELFEGLYIYDRWDWSKTHPVIKLDFSKSKPMTVSYFRRDIFKQLNRHNQLYDYHPETLGSVGGELDELIYRAYTKTKKKIVILIDEYDAPMIQMTNSSGENYEAVHTEMRGILGAIKANREFIEFVFMTGILKLSQHDFFSAANVFKDISLNPEFNEICGYTEEEVLKTFQAELERPDLSKDISIDTLREWYDGYRWAGETRLFNPNDVLITFDENFLWDWFTQYGLTTLATETIRKRRDFAFEDFSSVSSLRELRHGISLEKGDLTKLLFQSGYITIKSKTDDPNEKDTYVLGVPNLEVQSALARLRLNIECNYDAPEDDLYDIRTSLRSHSAESLKSAIKNIFAKFTYEERPQEMQEKNFSMLMKSVFLASGFKKLVSEVHTQQGRADLVIPDLECYYIMEFKVLDLNNNKRGCAMNQIKERNYASRYREDGRVFFLGFEFTTSGIDTEPGDPPVTLAHLDWEEFPTRFSATRLDASS